MEAGRPPPFRKRQFEPSIIVICVRWYCRFCLGLRDLEELMAERGLSLDHTIIWRWVQRYGPVVHRRFQTVDLFLSETRDREAAKHFLKKASSNPDRLPPHVLARGGLRSHPAAIRELQNQNLMHRHCRHRARPYANNRIESDHRSIKRRWRAMQRPRSAPTARTLMTTNRSSTFMIRNGKFWKSPVIT